MDHTSSTPNPSPDVLVPDQALERAALLSGQARRSSRWYGNYLLVFAAGSFVMSVLTGTLQGRSGVFTTTVLWLAFLAVITIWITRKQTAIRGMTRLHLTVMAGWALAWGVTVIVGENSFPDRLGWWVLGGVAVALSPVVGAVVAFRRSA